MRKKITKRSVESITPSARAEFLWDTALPGFGVKVTPRGARIYVLQYRHGGRARRYTIGRHSVDVTAEEARGEAERLRGLVRTGHDPAGERAAMRAIPTLAELAESYMAEHVPKKKKASSAAEDRRNLDNHILPAFGKRKINDITRADVSRWHGAMRGKPIAANRCLALMSKMFNLADEWGLCTDGANPTRRIEKYPERKHERFLSEAELACLGTALGEAERAAKRTDGKPRRRHRAASEHPSAIAALRLLIFTGCRRGEILSLKWEHVDFERGCLMLPDSKTGAKLVPLGAPALELLSKLPRVDGNPYVLPGAVRGEHYVGLTKAWQRIRERATVIAWARDDDERVSGLIERLTVELGREPTINEARAVATRDEVELPAGLADVRLHDLRHSFASAGAGLGESLVVIGALLGHRTPATTARYAHLSSDPARAAADRISGRIAAAMRSEPGKVVALDSGRK